MPTSGTGSGTPISGGPSATGMVRSLPRTWLSLDRWRHVMGQNPLFFWGIQSVLAPPNSGCDYWMQYAHQDSSRVSRYELAEAIREAENSISTVVGYNLIPDWTVDERVQTERPLRAEGWSLGYTLRGQAKSVRTQKGFFISGGQSAKTLIDADASVTLSDEDSDGWEEMATVTVATTVTNVNEIRVYVPGYAGSDDWEIRPIQVSISGGTATIRFNAWLIVNPVYYEGFGRTAIDGDVDDYYLDTVDVYRVSNDPQSQATLIWESDGPGYCGCQSTDCVQCTFASQAGCIVTKDDRLGLVSYHPATWDSDTGAFSFAHSSVHRDADRLRLWYLSGWRDNRAARPYHDLDPIWEKCIAYLSLAYLAKPVCNCGNLVEFVNYWMTDLSRVGSEESFVAPENLFENPFGTTRAAQYVLAQTRLPGRQLPS